jgi:folate-binding protein YgfZ
MDAAAQVASARRAVLAVEHPELAVLAITGKDRMPWLNGLLTCDVAKRPEGEARYGLVLARNGRVMADVVVVVESERVLLVVPAALAPALRAHLDHHLVMEDAEVTEASASPAATGAVAVYTFDGPRSGEVLGAARAAGASGAVLDRTGLGGAIVVAPAGVSAARSAIEGAVSSAGGAVGDGEGWDVLRLERAVPRFGIDFDDKTYPQEASLEKVAVSFDKGCYLGQEVVCMLEMRGHVKRKLVPIVLEAADAPPPGAAIQDEAGGAAGEVTSARLSPTLGKVVGLAMVKRALAQPSAALVVGGAHARVVERPA